MSCKRSLLQSRGGSLHLPLLQNGECPFPCTPLLSALLLVTHTDREILPMFPGFRIMAVSMKGLQIGIARILSIATDVIHLQSVLLLEEQPTIGAAPALPLQQLGQSGIDGGVTPTPATPIHPVAIIGTAMAGDLDVPCDPHLAMRVEVHGVRIGGRCGEGQTCVPPAPVPLHGPGGRF